MNKYTQEEINKAISEVIIKNNMVVAKEINSPTAEELVEELK